MNPYIFISYHHGEPWTRVARRFHGRLLPYTGDLGLTIYLDGEVVAAGDNWPEQQEKAVNTCTHFVVLLCDDYWVSAECRKELSQAVERFEVTGSPRLLFVLGETMRPEHLSFDPDRRAGILTSDDPKLRRVGDIHFLGPFDRNFRLVRLDWENVATLTDQLGDLRDALLNTLESR